MFKFITLNLENSDYCHSTYTLNIGGPREVLSGELIVNNIY